MLKVLRIPVSLFFFFFLFVIAAFVNDNPGERGDFGGCAGWVGAGGARAAPTRCRAALPHSCLARNGEQSPGCWKCCMAALNPMGSNTPGGGVGCRGSSPHPHRGWAAPQRDPQPFNSAPLLSLQMSRSSRPSAARRSERAARPWSARRTRCPGSSRTGSRRQVGLPGVANIRQRPHGGGSGDGAGPGLRPNAELLASGTSGPTPPACHAGPGLLVGQLLTPSVTLSVLGDCAARGCVQRPNSAELQLRDRARHGWA